MPVPTPALLLRAVDCKASGTLTRGKMNTAESLGHSTSPRLTKSVALLVLLELLVACEATPLAADAKQVRQIQPEANSPCKFLGPVEVSGGLFYSSLPEAKRDMLAKIRNETAHLGGNAYVLTLLVAERGFSLPLAHGDAYACP